MKGKYFKFPLGLTYFWIYGKQFIQINVFIDHYKFFKIVYDKTIYKNTIFVMRWRAEEDG
jgi:hypothetical protein